MCCFLPHLSPEKRKTRLRRDWNSLGWFMIQKQAHHQENKNKHTPWLLPHVLPVSPLPRHSNIFLNSSPKELCKVRLDWPPPHTRFSVCTSFTFTQLKTTETQRIPPTHAPYAGGEKKTTRTKNHSVTLTSERDSACTWNALPNERENGRSGTSMGGNSLQRHHLSVLNAQLPAEGLPHRALWRRAHSY